MLAPVRSEGGTVIFRIALAVVSVALLASALALNVAPQSDGPYALNPGTRIAIGDDGRIYSTDVRRSAIQIFDSRGEYLGRLDVPAKRGGFTVNVGEGGVVEVAVFRTSKIFELAKDGSGLIEKPSAESNKRFRELTREISNSATDSAGNRYEVRANSIVRFDRGGEAEVVVSPPRAVRPSTEVTWLLLPMAVAFGIGALLGADRCGKLVRQFARIRYGAGLLSRRSRSSH